MCLLFAIPAGPRQRSHSQVRVPQDTCPYFTVSDSGLLEPGGPGPRVYIPQEHRGLVIPPSTGFSFHCLVRLSGLWWKYSTPPLHGMDNPCRYNYSYINSCCQAILVSDLYMPYHNFYCIISCRPRSTKTGLRHLYSWSYVYTDTGCPVIELISF
jgi:hypothetical protein